MSNRVVMDFDDLAEGNDPLPALTILKERDPGFKVTLFAIPTRLSDTMLMQYDERKDWIDLGIHGWRHARHECLAWTSEETAEKIDMARRIYPSFVPIFKAPNWEICDEVYDGLANRGVAVADHIRNIEILPYKMPHYIYNIKLRKDKFTRLHGHIQPWAGTGLTEEADASGINPKYLLPVGTEYAFCTDAIANHKEVAV